MVASADVRTRVTVQDRHPRARCSAGHSASATVTRLKFSFCTGLGSKPSTPGRNARAGSVEAYGRPGMYVVMAQVMRRANISDPEEFRAIAEYLEQRGWIGEADPDYGVFVLTHEGIDEATN